MHKNLDAQHLNWIHESVHTASRPRLMLSRTQTVIADLPLDKVTCASTGVKPHCLQSSSYDSSAGQKRLCMFAQAQCFTHKVLHDQLSSGRGHCQACPFMPCCQEQPLHSMHRSNEGQTTKGVGPQPYPYTLCCTAVSSKTLNTGTLM